MMLEVNSHAADIQSYGVLFFGEQERIIINGYVVNLVVLETRVIEC
jgi:hypothetical protein